MPHRDATYAVRQRARNAHYLGDSNAHCPVHSHGVIADCGLVLVGGDVRSSQYRDHLWPTTAADERDQPPCPAEGYIWTPGYWAFYDYDYGDYYWVPGTWVTPPQVGFLWTPGYWGWGGDRYVFHQGYWGQRVGFYGGINYGFGYFGRGYEGGRWEHDHFYYNRSVNNVNVTNIRNVYNTTIINNTTVNRVSYNGGRGGINAHATREQEEAARERHLPPVAAQNEHMQAARSNPAQRAAMNHGKPGVAASDRPGAFSGRDAVPAREAGGAYNPPNRGEPGHGNAGPANVPRPGNNVIHPRDLPARERGGPPNTGNPKTNQKYQRDQERLAAKEDRDRQKLQQKQDQEHQKIARQQANEARNQQLEQRHQQQTQKLQQRQVQQEQRMQHRQQPHNQPHNQPPHNEPQHPQR